MDSLEVGDLGTTFFDVAWDLTYFAIELEESQSLGSMAPSLARSMPRGQ